MRFSGVFVLGLLLAACSGDPADPEQQVRDTIAAAEQAGEERDMGAIADLVHDDYKDRDGRDRQTLLQHVRLYLVARQSFELLIDIEDIKFPANDFAEVTLGIAGLGNRSAGPPLSIDAETFQVDLVINDDEEWQLIGARRLRD